MGSLHSCTSCVGVGGGVSLGQAALSLEPSAPQHWGSVCLWVTGSWMGGWKEGGGRGEELGESTVVPEMVLATSTTSTDTRGDMA